MSRSTSGSSAEQNRATLKQLVKLESNKSCADCKRNKHPRWASWNLGVFICIRCSGIHRGMGTHISRVKSVDLDTWTDEQTQSMVRWGNSRANRYFEAKLAEGHVPNEAKIENFIRTKYDSKRWVMDGGMPDPSTLGAAGEDDDVPLHTVQENLRAKMGNGGVGGGQHTRNGSATVVGGPLAQPPRSAVRQQKPVVDLFGDSEPVRASSAQPVATQARTTTAAPPKQTRPNESLLGLDFLGGGMQSAPPARAASASPSVSSGTSGRSDLKQSILSLYASKPAPAPTPQSSMNAFGGMQSPPLASPSTQSASSALGGLGDAFGSLSFSSTTQAKPSPFSNFSPPAGQARTAAPPAAKPSSTLMGGSFFDTKPAVPPKATASPPIQQISAFDNDFGDFSSAASPPPLAASSNINKPQQSSTSSMGNLFGLSSPAAAAPAPPPKATAQAPSYSASAFNLSQPAPAPSKPAAPATTAISSNMDAWGSSDAWATPEPPKPTPSFAAAPAVARAPAAAPAPSSNLFDSGWGDSVTPAKPATNTSTANSGGFSVQQDEEFGGWSHASPVATPSAASGAAATGGSGFKASGSGGGSDDLFGNVWG